MTKLLIVDDEENQLRVLSIGLRLEGFEVVAARSGEAALQKLGEGPVDLAIVDLMMPGTNGLELARQVRELHPEVLVVLTSAYHLSDRQLARADCGVVGFVAKPYALGELATYVRARLSETNPWRSSGEGSQAELSHRLA